MVSELQALELAFRSISDDSDDGGVGADDAEGGEEESGDELGDPKDPSEEESE